MILVIFIKAVAELGVIPYTHLFIVNFLLAIKPKNLNKFETKTFFGNQLFLGTKIKKYETDLK